MSRTLRALAAVLLLVVLTTPSGSSAPPASLRIGVGDDSFGVAHVTTPGVLPQPARVKNAVEMGATWDRFPFYWYDIQETRGGPMVWGNYDATVKADIDAGLKVQGILLGYPKWGTQSGDEFLKDWDAFVRATVARYKGKVTVWEVWNEPDLKADNSNEGVFWKGSPAEYYALLKVSYKAIKAVDPTVTVLHAGLSFTYNNQDWFPRFLEAVAADPTAKENSYYFDALALHQYGRPSTLFDLPVGYVGKPSFAGFHNLMKAKGFDKPIWANEVGVPVWNTGSGQNGPGRATMDEGANFVLQSFAYAFAGGIDRVLMFQLYDDGASSIDPNTKQPADYFGLISNSGEIRPSFRAFQQAVDWFSGAKAVTRVNTGRKEAIGQKGLDAITFWGTPAGKVTVAWNNVGGKASELKIPAAQDTARLLDKTGKSRDIRATGGSFALTLPGATNNNNFGCVSGKCEPEDYIIGGETQILVENVSTVPSVIFSPIGPGSLSPFTLSWQPVGANGSGWTYDVQVQDTADGVWRDWLTNTAATSASYGDNPAFPAQFERTYLFRVRARSNGQVVGMGYTPNALASTVVLGGKTSAGPAPVTTTVPAAPAAPTRPSFFPVAAEFTAFYDRYDGLRTLGRAISPAYQAGGGKAQYFEKGRLEDHAFETNDPNWRFQYGLLVDELQTGKSDVPVGGDVSTVSYATIATAADPAKRVEVPANYSGNVLVRPDGSAFIPFSTDLKPAPGHTVPAMFWKYLQRTDLFPGGWLHDLGLPITEPIEATVTKGPNAGRKITVQAFQRAILTYDPANPADWQVEQANVGTDYWKAFRSRVPQ